MKISRCHSCSAPIIWAVAATTRKRMPLDAEPGPGVGKQQRGLFILAKSTGEAPLAIAANWFFAGTKPLLGAHDELAFYRSHFATCPNAAEHRKAAA